MSFARSKLSLASVTSIVIPDMTDSAMDAVECNLEGREVGMMGGIRWGEHPRWSWNPEYPIEALMVFIMQNCMQGRACTHPFWFHLTWKQIGWLMVLLVLSLVPSVCG